MKGPEELKLGGLQWKHIRPLVCPYVGHTQITLLNPTSPVSEGLAYRCEKCEQEWVELITTKRGIVVVETYYHEGAA